jgi:predicted nucleic acid-binding protein
MKTAVDSAVLLDVFLADPRRGAASGLALKRAYDRGLVVACEIVWAEVRAAFGDEDDFRRAMDVLGVRFEPLGPEASADAGRAWRESRSGRGKGRAGRVLADYLVGAHARRQAEGLLTRDAAFQRKAFRGLKAYGPEESARKSDSAK